MEFSIKKSVLLHNLNFVSKAISSKSPIPALSGVKFDLTNEGLTLVGSSLETTIKAFIPVMMNGEDVINVVSIGSVIINESYISEIVKKVEEDVIRFELLDNSIIRIFTESSMFNLNFISKEEYPKIEVEKSDDFITFNKGEINTIIGQTVFSVSRNESRPILTGVCFNFVGDSIIVNATDSFRLSHKVIKHNKNFDMKLIIPGKTLADLNSICGSANSVNMYLFGNKVMFEFENVLFQTKLLEGTYPNTEKLIPEDFSTEFYVDSNAFIKTIERASILSRDKTKNVVELKLSNLGGVISSNSPEVGRVEDRINFEYQKPGDFSISFSARFIKEAIQSLNTNQVLIKLNGDMKPIVITNPSDESVTQLVLPVRTY